MKGLRRPWFQVLGFGGWGPGFAVGFRVEGRFFKSNC